MIHDKARVDAIRARVNEQLALIDSLKVKIAAGNLEKLDTARSHAEGIESVLLAEMDRTSMTPAEEAAHLSNVEFMLEIWVPYITETQQEFAQRRRIEIIGG